MYRGYDFFTNFFDRFKGASTSSCTRNNVALMDFFFFLSTVSSARGFLFSNNNAEVCEELNFDWLFYW